MVFFGILTVRIPGALLGDLHLVSQSLQLTLHLSLENLRGDSDKVSGFCYASLFGLGGLEKGPWIRILLHRVLRCGPCSSGGRDDPRR